MFVLGAALLTRLMLRSFGIPSIISLLAFGLLAGPSGIGLVHLDLVDSSTRALLSLAVVIVLFEATLRIDVRNVPRRTIAILAVVGTALVMWLIPALCRAYHFTPVVSEMAGAICIVTGPTVIGPLMKRLRPRTGLAHVLETEGIVLDAIGVIVAAAVFATFTSRSTGPLDTGWLLVERVLAGIVVGAVWGTLGRLSSAWINRTSSDISKLYLLLLGFGAYGSAEWLAHESGLVAVVVCGLLLDFKALAHERVLRAFKEDLSMLALSTVFILLASQIDITTLTPMLAPASGIVGALIAIRFATTFLATIRGPFHWHERLFLAAVFPRGIVAVSLATYYATQLPAWGLRGGDVLLSVLFVVVVITIALSTACSVVLARAFGLTMPSLIIAGISPASMTTARRYLESGHMPFLIDTSDEAVAFARTQDLEAERVSDPRRLASLIRARKAEFVVVDSRERWRALGLRVKGVPIFDNSSPEVRRIVDGVAVPEPV